MGDYIEKQEAIDAAKHAWAKGLEPTQYIEQILAADVRQVVRGRWRWVGQDQWNDCYECSQCGKMNTDNSNFCPNCGADMRGGSEQ